MSLEEIYEIRKQFAEDGEEYKSSISSSHNSFGAFISKANTYILVGRWVCHGWLKEDNLREQGYARRLKEGKGAKYVLSLVMKAHVEDKVHLPYIDWLANRSPWSSVFVDKDAERINSLGWVVDADNDSSLIGSAMIATRFMTESYMDTTAQKLRIQAYQEMVEAGVEETQALLFAHIFSSERVGRTYPIVFAPYSSGHSPFYGKNYQEDYVRNFFQGRPQNLSGNLVSKVQGYPYDTLSKIWGEVSSKNSFLDWVKGVVPKSKVKKGDLNIFRKAPSSGFAYLDREDFLSVLNQVKERVNA